MKDDIKLIIQGLALVLIIPGTMIGIFWGLPAVAGLFDSVALKIISVLLLIPVFPTAPALIAGLKPAKAFKLYIYELAGMLWDLFFILILLPSVAVSIFMIIGGILVIVSFLGIILWLLNHPAGGHFLSGLGYRDLLYYATVFNVGSLAILGSYYLGQKLEQGAMDLGDKSASALTVLLNFRKKRRRRIRELKVR